MSYIRKLIILDIERMKKKIKIFVLVFLCILAFILLNEFFIGPAKIPTGLPLKWDEILDNLNYYLFETFVITIIFILAMKEK
jgi:hypothetical protein